MLVKREFWYVGQVEEKADTIKKDNQGNMKIKRSE